MSCDNYPSKKDVEDFALNAKVINEFATSDLALTPSAASDGKNKITLSEIWRQANENSVTSDFLYDHTWFPWGHDEPPELGRVYRYTWSKTSRVVFLIAKKTGASFTETPDFNYFDVVSDVVNPRDYGAVGDAIYYNADDGGWYSDAAKTITATDDTAAMQMAMDIATGTGLIDRAMYIPSGRYMITRTLKTFGYIDIVGDGINSTSIACSNDFSGDSLIDWVTNSGSFPYAYRYTVTGITLDANNMTMHCMSSGSSSEWSNNVFSDVRFANATRYQLAISTGAFSNRFMRCEFLGSETSAAIACSGLSFSWMFNQCLFGGFGVGQEGYTIGLSHGINWSFNQCRMESGGNPDAIWLSIRSGYATFTDCWIERCNGVFVSESLSLGLTKLTGCRLVLDDGFKFDSDGVITLDSNSVYDGASKRTGTARINFAGKNGSLSRNSVTSYSGEISDQRTNIRYPASDAPTAEGGAVNVVNVSRSGVLSASTIATSTIELTVNAVYHQIGGFQISFSHIYHIAVSAISSAAMSAVVTKVSSSDSSRGTEMSVSIDGGATSSDLAISVQSTVSEEIVNSSVMQVTATCIATTNEDGGYIVIN